MCYFSKPCQYKVKKTGEENAEISQLRGSIKKLMNYQFLKSNFVRNGAFSKENLHFMHVFFSSPPIVSTTEPPVKTNALLSDKELVWRIEIIRIRSVSMTVKASVC